MVDVIIYASGLIHCSVCVPKGMTIAELEAAVNVLNPTGIRSPWQVSKLSHFLSGESNPCVCEQPNGIERLHYLMEC